MNFWSKFGRFLFNLFIYLLIFASIFIITFSITFYVFFNYLETSEKDSRFVGGKNLIQEMPVIQEGE